MPQAQSDGDLFAPVRNRGAFSGHWLDHRLPLEPEWADHAAAADAALDSLESLWKKERTRVDRYGDEQGLEYAFVQPVLEAVGWKPKYQTHLQGRKPDYALFRSDADLDAALAAGRESAGFWTPAAAVADAKRWDLSLDKPAGKGAAREYPPEQIEWYLDRSRKPFGILTNGRLWRLVPRELEPHQRRYQTYFEVDLAAVLSTYLAPRTLTDRATAAEDFRRFYLLFGAAGYATPDGRTSLVRRAVDGSSEYRTGVSEDLKGQAFEALRLCIEGFLAYPPNGLTGADVGACRAAGFTLLCRLLFVLFAEDRRLLPYRRNATYTNNRSLARQRDEIADRLDKAGQHRADDFPRDAAGLWDDLGQLFDLIDRGHGTYGVPAYNGGLFDPEANPFLADKKLSDWHLARVVDMLGRAPDPGASAPGGRVRVDYRDLALQHLGGVYEGLLELRPTLAAVRMAVYQRKAKGVTEERYLPDTDPKPAGFVRTADEFAPGSVYLLKDKAERRAFGSYYTPDHIVGRIVEATLGPPCDAVEAAAAAELAAPGADPDAVRAAFPGRVLALKVLDPSMGSGHFLLAACQYLAERIATSPHTPDDDTTLADWKRRVAEACLYGVDLNPLAVDLAKLALWLETVSQDRPLTFLDHHLRHGNSLIGAPLAALGSLPGETGLTACAFGRLYASRLPALLQLLAEVRGTPSDTRRLVKKKADRYRQFEKRAGPFRRLADLWAAAAAGAAVDPVAYADAARAVAKPKAFYPLVRGRLRAAARAARRLAPLHWELAFPEVFSGGAGGFDAVVGNPPYEVLSAKESGADPAALKAFVAAVPAYRPAVRGKQNLYKLFTCRAVGLLRDGGHFGFIVPMALLGDDQARGVREYLTTAGRFSAVDAFPQKDSPRRRVFEDAKLSTAVFAWVKGGAADGRPFVSRVHPANVVEAGSPSLTLTTADIPLYDPDNLTVASCGQDDWDLAVRIVRSGRMARLGEFCTSYQGELNEAADKTGSLSPNPGMGPLVQRGAAVCLYKLRDASQGDDVYLNEAKYLSSGQPKAAHTRVHRIGFQRKAPQNNFRRIIAAPIPAGEFCNHTINYCTETNCQTDLGLILAVLNSELADWYFRLGSSNAQVNEYQFNILPCPKFRADATAAERAVGAVVAGHLSAHRPDRALGALGPLCDGPPFSPVVRDAVVAAVDAIVAAEAARGPMTRSDRSALSPAGQPFQDFLDAVFFRLAGLTAAEVAALRTRYEAMKKVK